MKIYFAGSIRGGRDDAGFYAKLIEVLQQYGTVLTEHIGLKTLTDNGEQRPPEEIFERDTAWVKEVSVVVAEVTQPSLGVGYEIGLAESLRIPVLCLFRTSSDKRLSAMISGNTYCVVKKYDSIDDAVRILAEYFKKTAK